MDKKVISDFLHYISNTPFDGNQESCGVGDNYWNADMWTIEVAKCLYFGSSYSMSSFFKNNGNYNIKEIIKDANIKISLYKNLKLKSNTDSILICEVGRGLDIVIANMVRKWNKIYCYDQVNYNEYLKYFGNNIRFFHVTTSGFRNNIQKYLSEDVTMICNHSIYKPLKHEKIIHTIIDGELRW
jgi:hypothetical protein